MSEMTLSPRAVNMLRVSMAECEKAIGTEYADVYTAKLIGTLETILTLAEPEVTWTKEDIDQIMSAPPIVPPAPTTDLDEPAEEMDDDTPKRKRTDVDHDEIRKMLSEGVMVNEISERTGVGISTIYKIKKMQRDMEAK